MKQMTPRNIARACGGTYFGPESVLDREVTSVTVDSREAKPGCLYVPMRGTRADGHDFIPKAMKEEKPAFPCIRVDSTAEAIQKIAGFYRRALGIPMVGITGSVGKTSTKEMIAAVLSRKYRVLKTAGNFNNNLGLPLTIFRLTEEDDIAVLEMGISHFGEMEKLADTAEPDTMVITNIGECHLEFLGDRDGVFRAKTECFHYMKPDGTVILNGEDDKLSRVAEVNGRKPVFYGCDPKFRVYADDAIDVTVKQPGRHMVMNALAGAAVGSLYGLTMEEIRDGIESLETLGGRLHQIETKSGYMVIDDCYNANPMSMKASCGILSGAGTRTVAILGDMGELGKDEAALHREVGESVGRLAIDEYVTVGTLSENLAEGIRSVRPSACVRSFAGVEELLPALPGLIQKGDTVLVKASHFMQFERIVKVLTEE